MWVLSCDDWAGLKETRRDGSSQLNRASRPAYWLGIKYSSREQAIQWTYLGLVLASINRLHLCRLRARYWASPQLRSSCLISEMKVLRYVGFSIPGLRLPAVIHCRANLGIRCWLLRRTSPSHFMRRNLIWSAMLLLMVFRALYWK